MKHIALIGGGSLGMQIAHHLRISGIEVSGCYDDVLPPGRRTDGIEVLGTLADLLKGKGSFTHALMAIGYAHMEARQRIFGQVLAAGIPFHTFVHPSAVIDPSAILEDGAVVYPGCIVDRQVRIMANVLLNLGCIVSHDSVVGAHSFLAPGVVLAGNVTIGERNFVGAGTVFRDGLRTTAGCRFGAGSVVVKDAVTDDTYFGNPARARQR